jgi:NADH-quinone oxidoreductase subunit M
MLASVGLPGLSGFVGEFLALIGTFRVYWWAAVISMAVVILSAWYMMWMYQRVVWVRAPGEPPDASDPASKLAGVGGHHGAPHPVMGGSTAHDPHFVPPQTFKDVDLKELVTLVPLALLTLWIGVQPGPTIDLVKPAVELLTRLYGGIGL